MIIILNKQHVAALLASIDAAIRAHGTNAAVQAVPLYLLAQEAAQLEAQHPEQYAAAEMSAIAAIEDVRLGVKSSSEA